MRARMTAAILLFVLAGAPAALAQAPCSLQTITGTYAIQETSFSAKGSLSPASGYYQLIGLAIVLVGQVTISPTGAVSGSYWGVYGAAPIPEMPTPAGLISVNRDCTAEYTDASGEAAKLVILDGGNEIQDLGWGENPGNSMGTWYRITRADEAAPRCGVQSLNGAYMQRCEGFHVEEAGGSISVSTANLLMKWSAQNGSFAGTIQENQFGYPRNTLIDASLTGTYTVTPDCKVDMDFAVSSLPPGLTIKARGVLFEQGKQGVGVPMGIYAGSTMVAPFAPQACRIVRIGQ